MSMHPRIIASTAVLLAISACGPDPVAEDKRKNDAYDAEQQAEINILTDISGGPAEIGRRLRKYVLFRDGMIVIHNTPWSVGSYTVPANTPWSVECGMGLTVTFGAQPRSGADDIGTGPELYLSFAPFSPEACDELGPTTGKELQTILSGK